MQYFFLLFRYLFLFLQYFFAFLNTFVDCYTSVRVVVVFTLQVHIKPFHPLSGVSEIADILLDNNELTTLEAEVWRPLLEDKIHVYLTGQDDSRFRSHFVFTNASAFTLLMWPNYINVFLFTHFTTPQFPPFAQIPMLHTSYTLSLL